MTEQQTPGDEQRDAAVDPAEPVAPRRKQRDRYHTKRKQLASMTPDEKQRIFHFFCIDLPQAEIMRRANITAYTFDKLRESEKFDQRKAEARAVISPEQAAVIAEKKKSLKAMTRTMAEDLFELWNVEKRNGVFTPSMKELATSFAKLVETSAKVGDDGDLEAHKTVVEFRVTGVNPAAPRLEEKNPIDVEVIPDAELATPSEQLPPPEAPSE